MHTDKSQSTSRPFEVLLVEDDEADVGIAKRIFSSANFENKIHIASDGVEAIEFLEEKLENSADPVVDMVLLDLNLPRKNGLDFLREIRGNPNLRRTIVLVLSSSSLEYDITKCYEAGANGYLIKPSGLEKYSEVVESIGNFWVRHNMH